MLIKFKQKIKKLAARLISKSSNLCSLYYFFSKSFHQEHFTVFSGRYKNRIDESNIGNFRRNIHRIEKGLITRPLKPIFAETYLLETVQLLKILQRERVDSSTLNWAFGILIQYFNTVEETLTTKKANKIFQQIVPKRIDNLPATNLASNRIISGINYNDFLKLNIQRRSIRYYKDLSVPHDLVEKAIEVALQAPSACNRQPFIFRIIDDPILLKEASTLPLGAETFATNIKMLIFIIGDLSNYFDERDKHLIYIDSALATMNFILALETLGLSSCVINWADIPNKNRKLKKFLNLENWEQCVLSISVGYALPNCGIPSSIKKNAQNIIKYN